VAACDKCNKRQGDNYRFYVVEEDSTDFNRAAAGTSGVIKFSLGEPVLATVCRSCVTQFRLFHLAIMAVLVVADVVAYNLARANIETLDEGLVALVSFSPVIVGFAALALVLAALQSREHMAKRITTRLRKKQQGLGTKKKKHEWDKDLAKKLYTQKQVERRFGPAR
jgi:hypothetical protein